MVVYDCSLKPLKFLNTRLFYFRDHSSFPLNRLTQSEIKPYAYTDRFVKKNPSALTDIFYKSYKVAMKLISSAEAAEKLGVHITRVQVLIREGRLPAQKVGRNYVINEADLKLVKERQPGRPKKQSSKKISRRK